MKKIFITLFGALTLTSITAFGASDCQPGGSLPVICKSVDGQYEIKLHPRFYWQSVSQTSFCNDGYLKFRGVELNGKPDGIPPFAPALEMTEATTTKGGLLATTPGSSMFQFFSSIIYYSFGKQAKILLNDPHIMVGSVFVAKDEKSAVMYTSDDKDVVTHYNLTCSQ